MVHVTIAGARVHLLKSLKKGSPAVDTGSIPTSSFLRQKSVVGRKFQILQNFYFLKTWNFKPSFNRTYLTASFHRFRVLAKAMQWSCLHYFACISDAVFWQHTFQWSLQNVSWWVYKALHVDCIQILGLPKSSSVCIGKCPYNHWCCGKRILQLFLACIQEAGKSLAIFQTGTDPTVPWLHLTLTLGHFQCLFCFVICSESISQFFLSSGKINHWNMIVQTW